MTPSKQGGALEIIAFFNEHPPLFIQALVVLGRVVQKKPDPSTGSGSS